MQTMQAAVPTRRLDSDSGRALPLDKQHGKWTGTYPSLGPGESLAGQIKSFAIGHGLFSLVDAFPFQPPRPPPDRAPLVLVDGRLRRLEPCRLPCRGQQRLQLSRRARASSKM